MAVYLISNVTHLFGTENRAACNQMIYVAYKVQKKV